MNDRLSSSRPAIFSISNDNAEQMASHAHKPGRYLEWCEGSSSRGRPSRYQYSTGRGLPAALHISFRRSPSGSVRTPSNGSMSGIFRSIRHRPQTRRQKHGQIIVESCTYRVPHTDTFRRCDSWVTSPFYDFCGFRCAARYIYVSPLTYV